MLLSPTADLLVVDPQDLSGGDWRPFGRLESGDDLSDRPLVCQVVSEVIAYAAGAYVGTRLLVGARWGSFRWLSGHLLAIQRARGISKGAPGQSRQGKFFGGDVDLYDLAVDQNASGVSD